MSASVVLMPLLAFLLLPAGGFAQIAPQDDADPLRALAFVDERLRPAAALAPLEPLAPDTEAEATLAPEALDEWQAFAGSAGTWSAYVGRKSGRIESAEGAGIPWIPGRGNALAAPAGLASGKADLRALEAVARAFAGKMARALGIDPRTLALNPGRSGQPAEHLWLVDFDVVRDGLTVEGARVVFRVNHGNLVQFGAENLPPPGAAAPPQKVSREKALAVLAAYLGGFSAADRFVDGGSPRLVTTGDGNGRGLARVWQFVFKRKGSLGTWQARVDAATGELLELRDVNHYAQVTGGAFPESPAVGGESVLPMPFADVSSVGYASSAGTYNYPGGAITSSLNGQYVRISDSCGPIQASSSGSGQIALGTSAASNCATPGTGGAGNTRAARTQYYHVNRIKEVGRGWLPDNDWLQGKLRVNVNIPASCNAFWDGSTINFYRSNAVCGNTGEIAAIALHEYGHGLDDNDGNPAGTDFGTAEAYADITAALMLRKSCMGQGFFSGNCGGYGDPCTSCSGVRDIDWARRASNTPHTVANYTQARCPASATYTGPCGREGHCESYIASEAVWDLVNRDLPNPGSNAAWATAERLWYLSRSTATAAFSCSTATPTWTSNGCNAGSLWRVLRAVDDDDGNLANGTPNSCHLFAAFNRHGIACADDAGANVCFSSCTPPAAPAVSLNAGHGQVQVSWTSSGGATTYDVYRSETGCGAGFVRVARDLPGTSFTDTGIANGRLYSYQVVAHGTGNTACSAAPTACQSAAPVAPPCPAVAAPAGLVATVAGIGKIQVAWLASPGATEYQLYRATTAGGPYTLVRSQTGTSYLDTVPGDGVAYHYVVTALADECPSGRSNEAVATSPACDTVVLYRNDFETGAGLSNWTAGSFNGAPTTDWRGIQACAPAPSGSKIFRFGGAACTSTGSEYQDEQFLFAQPLGGAGIAVPAGAGRTRLSFRHRWHFETGWDGGTLMVSTDGAGYALVPGSSVVAGEPYNGQVGEYPGCHVSNTPGLPIFTGLQSTPVETVVDLEDACGAVSGGTGGSGCASRAVRVAFSTIADCGLGFAGWFLDDVQVTACVPAATPGLDFHTVAPCRLVDTRNPDDPAGGPALAPGGVREFAVAGSCGIPATARALSVNVTVTQPGAGGHLTLYPADQAVPVASTINFGAGQTRANNATVPLSAAGTIRVQTGSTASVHLILDVNGYYQ